MSFWAADSFSPVPLVPMSAAVSEDAIVNWRGYSKAKEGNWCVEDQMSGVGQSSLDLLLAFSDVCKLANRYLGSREYYLPIGRDSMNELRNPINLEQKVTV
jgi:hypothetical protein